MHATLKYRLKDHTKRLHVCVYVNPELRILAIKYFGMMQFGRRKQVTGWRESLSTHSVSCYLSQRKRKLTRGSRNSEAKMIASRGATVTAGGQRVTVHQRGRGAVGGEKKINVVQTSAEIRKG
jgi:hypothetical protein